MAVRSAVLAIGGAAGLANTTAFTVPAGMTFLVKTIYGYSAGAITGGVFVWLGSPAPAYPVIGIDGTADKAFRWDGWLAIAEGWTATIDNRNAGIMQYWISGTALEGVVDLTSLLPSGRND